MFGRVKLKVEILLQLPWFVQVPRTFLSNEDGHIVGSMYCKRTLKQVLCTFTVFHSRFWLSIVQDTDLQCRLEKSIGSLLHYLSLSDQLLEQAQLGKL